MATRKMEAWSRIVLSARKLGEHFGVEVPEELSVTHGDMFRRQLVRTEMLADFLEEVEKALDREGEKYKTPPVGEPIDAPPAGESPAPPARKPRASGKFK